HRWPEQCIEPREGDAVLDIDTIDLVEGLQLSVLLSVGLDHANARKILLRACRDLTKLILHLAETPPNATANEDKERGNKRHQGERVEGELRNKLRHGKRGDGEGYSGIEEIGDAWPKNHTYLRGVVSRSCDQIPYLSVLKILKLKPLEVAKQVRAHLI